MKATNHVFIVLLLVMYSLRGFSRGAAADDSIKHRAALNNLQSKLNAPFGASALSNFISSIDVSSFFSEGLNGKVVLRGRFRNGWTGGLSVDQKIGKAHRQALPFSLTGISPGTTVSLSVNKMIGWHPNFDHETDREIATRMVAQEAYAKRNNIADPRTVGLREISMNGAPEEKRMALQSFANVPFTEPFFLDIHIGFTKKQFEFTIDSTGLTSSEEVNFSPVATFSVVKVFGSGFNISGYAALSYRYSQDYAEGDEMEFSIPFGTTNNYFTRTLVFGKPQKEMNHILGVEFRKNLKITKGNGEVANFAISPSVNFAIDRKLLVAYLPVYFIRGIDEKNQLLDALQGGIRLGYITNTEAGKWASFSRGFISQLIISAPLDFLEAL